MSKVRLYGATSGFVELAAPDVADDGVLTLPTSAQGILAANGGIGSNVVSVTKTDSFTTNSMTYVEVTGLNASITPTSDTSKVLVVVSMGASSSDTAANFYMRIHRGSTALSNQEQVSVRQSAVNQIDSSTTVLLDSPGTGLSVNYNVRIRSTGVDGDPRNVRVNLRGDGADVVTVSTITLIEVKA
jgi:hypothetical protein